MFCRFNMPADWDNHEEWEKYYQQFPESEIFEDIYSHFNLSVQYLGYFLARDCKKVWFPGCGLSLAPHIYQHLGFKVWATDIATAAIDKQKKLAPDCFSVPKIKEILDSILKEGEFSPSNEQHFLVHDFRTPLTETDFDCIVNVRSFQALVKDSMEKTAIAHYQALKPGGVAMFETINVHGEQRDLLENSLIQAGFYIPYYKTESWYRKALKDTGIEFVLILGNPIIPGNAAGYNGLWGKLKRKKDTKKLRSFLKEHKQRQKEEAKEVEEKEKDKTAKIAHIVYNTG